MFYSLHNSIFYTIIINNSGRNLLLGIALGRVATLFCSLSESRIGLVHLIDLVRRFVGLFLLDLVGLEAHFPSRYFGLFSRS